MLRRARRRPPQPSPCRRPSSSRIDQPSRDRRCRRQRGQLHHQHRERLRLAPFVDGFLLNNELTDFAFQPSNDDGLVANRVEPGKRPRSSMAPTLVFDRNGGW